MALSGLHVVFSSAAGPGDERSPSALLDGIAASQTITTGNATSAGPGASATNGKLVAHLIASEAGYFAINKSAAADPRAYLPAGETLDIFVPSNATISWLTA